MSRKTAGLTFLGVCIVLAVLLLRGAITPLVSGSVFAVALLLVGLLSRGLTGKGE